MFSLINRMAPRASVTTTPSQCAQDFGTKRSPAGSSEERRRPGEAVHASA
jgi:hypothetical protein